ncbi:hypothetical protein RSAG8_13790, partial [Rhizoctonia solani AG-8 WAC10335]
MPNLVEIIDSDDGRDTQERSQGWWRTVNNRLAERDGWWLHHTANAVY